MGVRAARLKFVAVLDERSGKRARVGDDLLGIGPETGLGRLQKRSCNTSNGLTVKLINIFNNQKKHLHTLL